VWRAEAGPAADDRRVGIVRSWLVTDDPERDWPPIRDAERYRMRTYARFFEEAGVDFGLGRGGDTIPQTWIVGDEDHVTAELASFVEAYGITDVVTWGAPPGIDPSALSASLERFATGVAPRLRQRFG
jgi:alkanesulfonate monooxygenase SsuD/methylene tetrahydromethanopterin reductase-like flavin-dependent oxidoreductase (luciferase family)